MGNYFELLSKLEDGQIISTPTFAKAILWKNGMLYYVDKDTHTKCTGWGYNGRVFIHDNLHNKTWSIVPHYEKITVEEAIRLLRNRETIYADVMKTPIDMGTNMSAIVAETIECFIMYTDFYVKK